MQTDIFLSVIIIGRNEGAGLGRLAASLQPLLSQVTAETLYVDSASSDDSVAVAHTNFVRTVELEPDANLNASAGRYVGTLLARGKWLLYLDGDMMLLPECVPALLAHMGRDTEIHGAIGNYVHSYVDGSTSTWRPPLRGDGFVSHFGGAVLLPAAGMGRENWDPRLFSNEEGDLMARLARHGVLVRSLNADFIGHYTESYSSWTKLHSIFIPRGSFLGKKFGGFGQLLHARYRDGRLGDYVRAYPELFVLWGANLAALVLFLFGAIEVAIAALVLGALYTALRKPLRMVIVYYAFAVQAVYGWGQLDEHWRPTVLREFTSGAV